MITSSPDTRSVPEGTLLRELNSRIDHGLSSVITLVSAAAVRSEAAETKRALSDVVEMLQAYGHLHRTLAMPQAIPQGQALVDAATHARRVAAALRSAVLDRMNIRLAVTIEPVPLLPERCWRLGLILHELVTDAARHACFDARPGVIKVKLSRIGTVVNCVVLDNGSRSKRGATSRTLRISHELAKELGGRVEYGFGQEFTSVVLSFQLLQRERQANWTASIRRQRSPRQLRAHGRTAPTISAPAESIPVASLIPAADVPRADAGAEVLRQFLSPALQGDAR